MTSYALKTGIRNELKSTIEEVSWLSGKVYVNTWRTDASFPHVLIRWERDTPELELTNGTYKHSLVFGVVFRNTYPSNVIDYDIIVSGVGAVEDKIIEYTTNYLSGNLGWEKAELGEVDYSYTSPGISPEIVGEAYLPIIITKET